MSVYTKKVEAPRGSRLVLTLFVLRLILQQRLCSGQVSVVDKAT